MQRKSKQTTPRWTAAAMLGLLAAAGVAQAVEFDEKIQAPRVTNVGDLRTEAQSFAAEVAQLQATSPNALIKDTGVTAQRFDLSWKIQRALDQAKSLGDLSSVGLDTTSEGNYRIDLSKNPEWSKLDELLSGLLPRSNWTLLAQDLIARGFREEDVATMQKYVTTHDADLDARQRSLPITLSFSRLVKKLDKLKRPVTDDMVLSYLYQREKVETEVRCDWTRQLLKLLDAQRVRILGTYYGDMQSIAIWAPSDQKAGIADLLASMRSPDFESTVKQQAQEITP